MQHDQRDERDGRARGAGRAKGRSPVTVAALCAFAVVMAFLAFGKRFVDAGPLWQPATTHVRELRLVPFHEFAGAGSGLADSGDSIGNIAFFVPFGFLVLMLLAGRRGAVWWAVLVAFATSAAIEVAQYALALGYSDIDDLICNTAGGAIGALLAARVGHTWRRYGAAAIGVGSAATVLLVLGVVVFAGGAIEVRR